MYSNKFGKQLFWLIALFTIFHILTTITIGLGDDEAYYWQWSKHLALSYYDHPPLIAYLIAISTHIFGNNLFGIRFFNLLSMPLLSYLIYLITDYLYHNKQRGLVAVLIFNLIPLFFLGALITTPDSPLMFFYVLGLYLFMRIVYEQKAYLWYILGLVGGLDLLGKYIAIFLYLSVFLCLIFNKQQRFWFARKEIYLALLISIIIFSPVIIWNYQDGWASFIFQFYSRHNHSFHLNYKSFLGYIPMQAAICSPILFVAFCVVLYKNRHAPDVKFLNYFILPPFVIFGIVALFSSVRFNWTVVAYVPLIIIFAGHGSSYKKSLRYGLYLVAFLEVIVIIQAFYPILRIKPLYKDPTNDFYTWQEPGRQIKDFMKSPEVDDHNWFVFANRFQTAAQLDWVLKNEYPVYSLSNHLEGAEFWQDEAAILGKNGLLVMNNAYLFDPAEKFYCGSIKLYKTIDIIRAGIVFRKVYIYQCFDYKGRTPNYYPHRI